MLVHRNRFKDRFLYMYYLQLFSIFWLVYNVCIWCNFSGYKDWSCYWWYEWVSRWWRAKYWYVCCLRVIYIYIDYSLQSVAYLMCCLVFKLFSCCCVHVRTCYVQLLMTVDVDECCWYTSKEVMFLVMFVCLSVCLFNRITQKYCSDICQILLTGWI